MHKLIATFFVFLYMIAMLKPIQPYIEYALNQDYIAEFLCINKEKPEFQCNGKCHLVKEIEKQQENEPLSSLRISLENYPIGFVTIYSIEKKSEDFVISNSSQFSYIQLYHFNYFKRAYQPPDLV
ncbi:hypothetical protein Q4Q35_09905 [Flavivirga aquimarina]|uniref:Uncharacterized protein n=1 Tax=Flavivirga aquimarina TaxID=2027862 RepID=A0ABT8WAP2_9FLAO|nr:hypothetical protein [Flavivirga aquimarina]MDO5970121.1 hypothetical protein [Flavivirga aquimarina]